MLTSFRRDIRMSETPELFEKALARFDAANAEDPNRTVVEGVEYPHELHYARRMTHWLSVIEPQASEALRLAARSQHLRRWMFPRSQYPMTRAGYHQWRTAAGDFHARMAGDILREVGYGDEVVHKVQSLLRKERLHSDPETQTLEDVACIVFLETEFSEFASRHDEQKVLNILRRTWKKMSERGRTTAAQRLELAPAAMSLIGKATATALPPGPEDRPPGLSAPP